MSVVLDSSAVLALLYQEQGHEQVSELLGKAAISSVNWAEVLQKIAYRGDPTPAETANALRAIGLQVLPFTAEHAMRAAELWATARQPGKRVTLSLADRACLATAERRPDAVVVTADRAWSDLSLDIQLTLIR